MKHTRAHVCVCVHTTMFVRGGEGQWVDVDTAGLPSCSDTLAGPGLLPSEAGLHTSCVVGRLPPSTLHLIYLVTEPHVDLPYIRNLNPREWG